MPWMKKDIAVDISYYPELIEQRSAHDEITIGDAHANTLKVIYFLIQNGVLKLKKGQEDYQELKRVYELPLEICSDSDDESDQAQYEITDDTRSKIKEALFNFTTILDNAEIGDIGLVRFIGDLTADRGNNDLFTLLVLEKLHNSGVKVENLISNHDVEFIHFVESDCLIDQVYGSLSTMPPAQVRSVHGLKCFFYNDLISLERFETLYKIYCSQLRFFSYTKGNGENEMILFSHAPTGLEVIPELIRISNIECPSYMHSNEGIASECTKQDLEAIIDNLNSYFMSDFKSLYRLIENTFEDFCKKYSIPSFIPATYPILRLCWNRDTNNFTLPKQFSLILCHGHDMSSPINGVCLDNSLGKYSKGGLQADHFRESWYQNEGRSFIRFFSYGSKEKSSQLSYFLDTKIPELNLSTPNPVIEDSEISIEQKNTEPTRGLF